MTDKKIVFFDIDGTIYRFNCGIPSDTMDSIKKLKEKGHIPVICTGRTRVMIYDEFLTPGFEYIIGGAGTYIEVEGETIFNYEMDIDEIRRVTDGYIKYGFSPVIEGKDDIYVEYENPRRTDRGNLIISNYRKHIGAHCREIKNSNVINASKISATFTPESDLVAMKNAFEEKYAVINHNYDLLELVPKPYSKAVGIEKLINRLGIDWENTYAFGDSFNDLEMLKYVKYGVCMGNSDPELFKYTEYRTDDFDKGGIAKALKGFGLID